MFIVLTHLVCQINDDNRSVSDGAAVPSHIIVVTKADAASLDTRITPFQQVEDWAKRKGLPCVAVEPTSHGRRYGLPHGAADIPAVRDAASMLATLRV